MITTRKTKFLVGVLVTALLTGNNFFGFSGEATENKVKAAVVCRDVIVENHAGHNSLMYEHKYWHEETCGRTSKRATKVETEVTCAHVDYKKVSCQEYTELAAEQGTGWCIDLDGDGQVDEWCLHEDAICVNGRSYDLPENENPKCWLMDIDATDGRCEILTQDGRIWCYDGQELISSGTLEKHAFGNDCTFWEELCELAGVDEHKGYVNHKSKRHATSHKHGSSHH